METDPKITSGRLQRHLETLYWETFRRDTKQRSRDLLLKVSSTGSYRARSVEYLSGATAQWTIMMSPDNRALEDLLYNSDLGDEAEGAELGGGPAGLEESAAAENTPTAVSIPEPMMCAGCSEQVCDRFFLLAAGRVWHSVCLRCSQCHCELQTHPSLYWRDGNIYCQQDYCRMFAGGQCARCFQPIPASTLVMRSGELTFHPHCFSCQECDVKLIPGNLYCMQGQNLYCQSHYHGDGSVPLPHNLQAKANVQEAQSQVSAEGEESVSSPEPRLDDRVMGERTRRRTKRIRTCFRSEQLRALESYFAQKHNPDGKDWTCLAHKTGLPKRVLQVWFQNARAKLRRSLTTDDSQANSPAAPPRGVTVATGSPSPSCSPPDQSQPFPTSTIDQLQLSLLTAPLSEPPVSPAVSQSHQLQHPSFFLDYDSQSAPGCSLEAYEDFGEAGGGAEGDVDADGSFRPHYC